MLFLLFRVILIYLGQTVFLLLHAFLQAIVILIVWGFIFALGMVQLGRRHHRCST